MVPFAPSEEMMAIPMTGTPASSMTLPETFTFSGPSIAEATKDHVKASIIAARAAR
jgi:hypothetical protein